MGQGLIRILGLDPGLRCMGWGVIGLEGSRLIHIAHGQVRPDPRADLAARLACLHHECSALIATYAPHDGAIEETFVNDNARSALFLGQARGAVLAALGAGRLMVQEFSPATIKKSVTGSGRAEKDQVAFMVARLLPGADGVKADAADALAVAITAAFHRPLARGGNPVAPADCNPLERRA